MNYFPGLFLLAVCVLIIVFLALLYTEGKWGRVVARMRNRGRAIFCAIRERGSVCELIGKNIIPARVDTAQTPEELLGIFRDIPVSQFVGELQERFLRRCDQLHLSREILDQMAHEVESENATLASALRARALRAIIRSHDISASVPQVSG
jgi:hypothetical protein